MDVLEKVKNFYSSFGGEKRILGRTYKGRDVYLFRVKKSASPKIIFTYAIHGREYITSELALKQIERFYYYGRHGDVYFVPVVNPDGVYLSLYYNPLNKANARCVDLNVNFPARFGRGEKNRRFPSYENYVGTRPFCERETRFLRDLTLAVKPDLTVSYHAKGEEIYFEFGDMKDNLSRDREVAEVVKKATGYQIKSTPNSCGGYKDWCIDKFKIPSLTIEVGRDELIHPIKEENLSEIYKKNKDVVLSLTEIKWLKNLWARQ